jgi:hypothetical protein
MYSARREVSGDDCVPAAFPADSLQGLAEAVTALERAYPSVAVLALVASLNPYHLRSSRSAVAGLAEQGRAALRAAPAVAGWFKLCVDNGVTAGQQDCINDALFRLSRLRADLDEADPVVPPAALERVRQFYDEVFQPYLLTLLVAPVRYWQRGIVGYLEGRHGDLEAVAVALHDFTVSLRAHTWGGSGSSSDWDEYTHSETLALIGRLGPALERLRVECEWLAQAPAEPPAQPAAGDSSSPFEHSLTWTQEELAAPSVSRRLAACRLLRQLGDQAKPAVPALRAMLAQLDGATPVAAVAQLREEALATLRGIEPEPEPATPASATDAAPARTEADRAPTEAADQLLALARDDTESSVRTAALQAIADAGVPIAGALAIGLRAAAAEDPQERAAAARLLAMLVR